MSIFVTVGSTGFDDLVEAATSASFLSFLEMRGYRNLVIQYGSSETIYSRTTFPTISNITVTGYSYKSSIEEDMKQADIIVSHAGSGTLLQALRLDNKKVVVVVNTSLMDNHQREIADVMESKNYVVATNPSNLSDAVETIQKRSIDKFPHANINHFGDLLDEFMGFL
ncbi:glycosyltransferase family 1 protein [Phycomyces blakesleeanus]|uniref:UDP-N-acetylglucosamine transferase subunit ALG13 n=2 Tax=Phycomyces blakesleeanus TaxID=4837 RepID=A0A162TGN1_PHYB8|nr:glycosyltransferase family 1 protein [Phycomyces blakesleeanus NRRL 1555(-)]OAD66993.1 glycosyltransferase family 1 protein [Phycomyces blakesleeanus NRRL 1555(-)]|eukprot:XP_018285033.1 glycosyltransferase family 1 protein [Phycomyces blakesleeanus NRRL 1555(-)]